MANITLLNQEGGQVGSLELPDAVFGVEYNQALVHQAIVSEEANQRQGTHNTKQRSDVRGGGRKPWKQKGTGRARQGTIRAPQWRGGGVVFGPHPRDYRKAFPVAMRRGAMRSVLSEKAREGNIIGLDALTFAEAKTKNAVALLKALNLGNEKHVLIVVPEHSDTLRRATRNLESQGLELRFAPNFSVRDALLANKIVIVQDAVAKIEAVWNSKSKQKSNNALGAQDETTEESAVILTDGSLIGTEGAEVSA